MSEAGKLLVRVSLDPNRLLPHPHRSKHGPDRFE